MAPIEAFGANVYISVVVFSLYPGLFWELRDKRNLEHLQVCRESLGPCWNIRCTRQTWPIESECTLRLGISLLLKRNWLKIAFRLRVNKEMV